MARYPAAHWRPLGRQSEPRLTRKNIVVLHTMVGSLGGTDSYFRSGGYDGVESHFGVGHDGTVYQWQDTNYQADAQSGGNDNCISIETADSGAGFPNWSGSNVPAWTGAQLTALVKLVRWLCDTHDVPKRLVPDSGAGRRGIGYHRQGVDPWRKDGTERWSSAYGKVCPGDRRIKQLKNVIIPNLDGGDWFDMATKADLADVIKEHAGQAVLRYDGVPAVPANKDNPTWQLGNTLALMVRQQQAMLAAISAMAESLPPTVQTAVREALADATVQVDVNVTGGDQS